MSESREDRRELFDWLVQLNRRQLEGKYPAWQSRGASATEGASAANIGREPASLPTSDRV